VVPNNLRVRTYRDRHTSCMRRILIFTMLLSACSASPVALEKIDNTTTTRMESVPAEVTTPETTALDESRSTETVPIVRGTRIVAVGDIACSVPSTCRHTEVASLVGRLNPAAFLVLGDAQYPSGSLRDFLTSYDASFGAWMPIVYPTPGNHEMESNRGGYDEYFRPVEDRVTVRRSKDAVFYSFEIGGWHFVSADSNHPYDKEQLAWLEEDLRTTQARCSAVFWHHPRFSSGQHGSSSSIKPLWEAAANGGADIVLSGHDHNYERFAPVSATGERATDGVVQFVVGTGGKSLRGAGKRAADSEIFLSSTDGVLELTLYPDKADFRFVSTSDETLDPGSVVCS
jgi:hypothetical protein